MKSSTVLTTNLGIASWGQIFDDPNVAVAMLDRLLHRSVVFNIDGDSYRMRAHRAAPRDPPKRGDHQNEHVASAPPHPADQLGKFNDRHWGESAIGGNPPRSTWARMLDMNLRAGLPRG